MFDRAFREYMTHIRATVLSKKMQCCTEWTFPQKKEALTNIPMTEVYGEIPISKACAYESGDPPKRKVDMPYFSAVANKDLVGYCEIIKVYANANRHHNPNSNPII